MTNYQYILGSNGEPKAEPDLMKWALWLETNERIIAKTEGDNFWVSTILLGLDFNMDFSPEATPIIWETMIKLDGELIWQKRCGGSREQALAMHHEGEQELKRVLAEQGREFTSE